MPIFGLSAHHVRIAAHGEIQVNDTSIRPDHLVFAPRLPRPLGAMEAGLQRHLLEAENQQPQGQNGENGRNNN